MFWNRKKDIKISEFLFTIILPFVAVITIGIVLCEMAVCWIDRKLRG
jgi:hypothetical protein